MTIPKAILYDGLQICICIDMLLIPILVLKPEAIKSLHRLHDLCMQ
jgi:hypothetical protein